ncbi:MAG: hypothetical protein IT445_00045 [Phycisphaeraceae bacterium]|nr:hypothetical protein [Phycisphaeraceae bacterium]
MITAKFCRLPAANCPGHALLLADLGLDWAKLCRLAAKIEQHFGRACIFGDQLAACVDVDDLCSVVTINLNRRRRAA